MKRLTLVFACALFLGTTATFAQDTTKTKPAQSDQLRKDDMKGYTKVTATEVPANLRTTLSAGTMYKGWDDASKSAIYRNPTGEYAVKIGEGTSKKVYHFDKDGKPTSKPQD